MGKRETLALGLARGSLPVAWCPEGDGGQASGAGRDCWSCLGGCAVLGSILSQKVLGGPPQCGHKELAPRRTSCPLHPIHPVTAPSSPLHPVASHRIPSHPIASHRIASHRIPSHPIPSHPIPSHPIPSHPLFYPIPSYPPFYSVSSHPIPSVLSHAMPCHAIPFLLFHSVPPLCFIPSHPTLYHLFYSVSSCPVPAVLSHAIPFHHLLAVHPALPVLSCPVLSSPQQQLCHCLHLPGINLVQVSGPDQSSMATCFSSIPAPLLLGACPAVRAMLEAGGGAAEQSQDTLPRLSQHTPTFKLGPEAARRTGSNELRASSSQGIPLARISPQDPLSTAPVQGVYLLLG